LTGHIRTRFNNNERAQKQLVAASLAAKFIMNCMSSAWTLFVGTVTFHVGHKKPSATRRSCNRFSKRAEHAEFSRVNASRLKHSAFWKATFGISISNERPGEAQGLEGELGSDGASEPSSLEARVASDAQLKAGDPGHFMALNLRGDDAGAATLTPTFEVATSETDLFGTDNSWWSWNIRCRARKQAVRAVFSLMNASKSPLSWFF